jgi:hypothetical protein
VRSLREALRRAPGLLRAHDMLGHIEIEVGRLEEGIFRLENVLALDASMPGRWGALLGHALRSRWDRVAELLALPAEEEGERMLTVMSRARLDLLRDQPVFSVVSESEARRSRHLYMARVMGLAARGPVPAPALADIERRSQEESPPGSRFRPLLFQFFAEIRARSGDLAGGLERAASAVDAGLFDLSWFDESRALDGLRADPRWSALRARMKERVAPVLEALDATLGA